MKACAVCSHTLLLNGDLARFLVALLCQLIAPSGAPCSGRLTTRGGRGNAYGIMHCWPPPPPPCGPIHTPGTRVPLRRSSRRPLAWSRAHSSSNGPESRRGSERRGGAFESGRSQRCWDAPPVRRNTVNRRNNTPTAFPRRLAALVALLPHLDSVGS